MKKKIKYKKSIELFHEKSGEVVRILRFKKPKDFDYFLNSFKLMRYPGYNWRLRKYRIKDVYNERKNYDTK